MPPTATITSAALTMHLSCTTLGGTQSIAIHKMQSNWGEGSSLASGSGGFGAVALSGDATWLHAFFPETPWSELGGDFSDTISATLDIENPGGYTWPSTAQLIADVRGWIQTPATNFGWILLGNESDSRTAKRFDSRENTSSSNRPKLELIYTFPNNAPTLANPIADQQLVAGQDFVAIDLSGLFSDRNGDDLSYAATSGDPSVASVAVSGSALSIMPLTEGTTTISLVADDGQGGTFVAPFAVAVTKANSAPALVGALSNQVLTDDLASISIAVGDLFTDDDGDGLSYTATSADTAIAAIALNGDTLLVQARAVGSTTLTLAGDDGRGGTAFATFAVAVQLIADFNADSLVDFADFFIFADNFGLADFNPAADLDGDGEVNFDDFFILADKIFKNNPFELNE